MSCGIHNIVSEGNHSNSYAFEWNSKNETKLYVIVSIGLPLDYFKLFLKMLSLTKNENLCSVYIRDELWMRSLLVYIRIEKKILLVSAVLTTTATSF